MDTVSMGIQFNKSNDYDDLYKKMNAYISII